MNNYSRLFQSTTVDVGYFDDDEKNKRDKYNNNFIMNLSTKNSQNTHSQSNLQEPLELTTTANNGDDDSAIPLNLCVKKQSSPNATTTTTNSKSEIHRFNNSYNNNNLETLNLVNNLANSQLNPAQTNNLPQHIFQLQQQQKKRGRKPKILNYNEQVPAEISAPILSPNFMPAATAAGNQPPRKRGRPSTLSPPHNNTVTKMLNTPQTSTLNSSNPSSAFYPLNFTNTLDPNWLATFGALNAHFVSGSNQLLNNNTQKPFDNFLLNNINSKGCFKNIDEQNAVTNEIVNNHTTTTVPTALTSKYEPLSSSSSSSLLPRTVNVNDNVGAQVSLSTHPSNIINKNSLTNSTYKRLRIPLNHGFKRQTNILEIKHSRIEGEVTYTTPCGKKIKNHSDLTKYLNKNEPTSLTSENFNFDPNVLIGEYKRNYPHLRTVVSYSESQMKFQLGELSKLRTLETSSTNIPVQPTSNNNLVIPEKEKKKRVRDSGGTRNVYDSIRNFNKSHNNSNSNRAAQPHHNDHNNDEPSVTITIQNAAPIRGTKRKSSEKSETGRNEKMLKKQQEEERREARERELRERELRERELREREIREARERQLELQKQEEQKLLEGFGQRRLTNHHLFIHVFNELKTLEDQDDKKEEINQEKIALQERTLLKKVLEAELVKELKKPVEDMMLKDHKNLPIFNRIPGLKLTGKAFSDLLMVYEFLYNFGETIGFDTDSLPTLNSLMMALLNLDSEAEDELMSIVNHLVICAIEDPGLPNNVTTAMGQKLKDAAVTEHNITEILRLYFLSFKNACREEDEPNRIECQIYERLCDGIPFLSLNAVYKLDILVFLCNELLCNQAIVKQIDESIESVSIYKKEKWTIENDVRKLRLAKLRREKIIGEEKAKEMLQQEKKENVNTNTLEIGDNDNTATEASDNEETNVSLSNSATTNVITTSTTQLELDEYADMTKEEIEKKIEKLNKQCNQMNNKMHKALNSYRVFPLGQDRYRRTYWVLPNCGGIFVEGMESGEPEELANNVWTQEELEMEKLRNEINEQEAKIDLEQFNEDEGKVGDEVQMDFDNEYKFETNKTENESTTVAVPDEEVEDINNEQEESEQQRDERKTDTPPLSIVENVTESTENSIEPVAFTQSEETDQTETEVDDNLIWLNLNMNLCMGDSVNGKNDAKKDDNKNNGTDDDKEKDENKDDDDLDDKDNNDEKDEQITKLEKSLGTFLDKETMECLFRGIDKNVDGALFKDCLLRIISSFAKSASITEFPNNDVQETDIIVCPTLQKRIQLWKVLQYDQPLKVPHEYQLGWWRITDGAQLKSMIELLNSNALREKDLQKYLIKHLHYAMLSCKNNSANLDVNDYDRDASEVRQFGAPKENRCPHKSCQTKGHCHEVALRKNLEVLELIEAFEEKILACSMQIRNWKPSNKLSSTDFKAKMNKNNKTTSKDRSNKKKSKNNENNSDSSNDSIVENGPLVVYNDDNVEYDLLRIQKEKLLEIEATIERRYLKPPLGFKNNQAVIVVNNSSSDNGNGEDYNDNATDDNATTGLIRWRDAAREAKCSSQIAMCLHFLENCIAWDKSIMRASCQFCGSGENEAQLLLCDLCDKGYHMYCFKPKMETVPSGDWFCFDCQNKNTIDKVCIVCGKKGKLLNCDTCAKTFHPNCLNPPVNKQVKGRWICHICHNNKRYSGSSKSKKSSITSSTVSNSNEDKNDNSKENCSKDSSGSSKRLSNGNAKDKNDKKERKAKKMTKSTTNENGNNKEKNKDKEKEKEKEKENSPTKVIDQEEVTLPNIQNNEIALCKIIYNELINHEASWPFLEPVNTKFFPTYLKVIKKPMDCTVIQIKFQTNSYKTKEEFAADVRLMFDNCVTFNEDESPVGQAGHELRAFFESRWKQVFDSSL